MSFATNNQNNSNVHNFLFGGNNNNSDGYKPLFQFTNDNNSENLNKSSNENKNQFNFNFTENKFKNQNDNTSNFPIFTKNDLNQDNSTNNFFKMSEPKIEIKQNENFDLKNTNNNSIFQNKIFTQIPKSNIQDSNQFNLDNNLNESNKGYKSFFDNNKFTNEIKEENDLSIENYNKSNNDDENLNDSLLKDNEINSEIIEELSSIINEKKKYLKNFEQWNKSYSHKIRLCLIKKTNENKRDESKFKECLHFLIVFSYFDFFIVHNDDFSYMTKLRDELIYEFLLLPDLRKENENEDNIQRLLLNLKKNLSICDITSSIIKLTTLIDEVQRKNIDNSKLYIDLFMQWKIFLTKLQSTFKGVNTSEFRQFMQNQNETCFDDCNYIINELKKNIDGENEYINLIQEIFNIITGNEVINENNRNNIHLTILSHLIFRFYKNNFIKDLIIQLENNINDFIGDDNLIIKTIINIIKHTYNNQLEIVQRLKGQYPFLLRFHMIDILNELGVFGQNRDNKFYMDEFKDLLMNLCEIKVKFKYFNQYYFWYPSSDEMDEVAKNYSIQYIKDLINGYNFNKIEEFIDEVTEVKEEVCELKNGENTKNEINKIIFEHFYDNKSYELAIDVYFEIMEYQKLSNLNYLNKNDLSSAGDNIISDDDIYFDKILMSLYNDTKDFNTKYWKNIYDNLIRNTKIQSLKIDFLLRYIKFILSIEDLNKNDKSNKNRIQDILKDFFDYAFIKNYCPSILWIPLLNLIKTVYDRYIVFVDINTLEIDDCSNVLNKVMMYEEIFREKLTQFNTDDNYDIDFSIQNAIDFLFDLKSLNYNPDLMEIENNN